ncbi:class II aldolase/adducin family protein [Methanococcus vannielii SB]|uniref:L-fuculose phosphate aldolase n=1 Tax=Methanococcus vannielii (strain ATCC 35089 / DSM 1224 / JCM 13029 / OCM 148 / SB) TaxID=406327 RepID=FUCA_METVS|nr:L-fuculose phosphate aldolase [Methanococcus vannielii]A6UPI8.1 RecName: Full=L-fuculose phosphate aldolase; AltName: Full=L-fuculose-1-phosphate aldolase [Methanococcus vannielii SB]ABR54410.1 class II aldolase/adducin family protein [Methanococcus vannielii SB]
MDLKEFIKICHLLYDRKYVVGSGGNVSLKKDNLVYITPTGSILGFLNEEDICVVDIAGKIIKGKPTSELNMHLEIYRNKPHVNAVVHTHSMYCTAFSVLDKKLELYTPEAEIFLKKIGYVDYCPCGTLELAECVSSCNEDVLILKKHGIVTLGSTLTEAYIKTEVLEEIAKLNHIVMSFDK